MGTLNGESVEHKHEFTNKLIVKDGKMYVRCNICGELKLHWMEEGDALREKKTKTER